METILCWANYSFDGQFQLGFKQYTGGHKEGKGLNLWKYFYLSK